MRSERKDKKGNRLERKKGEYVLNDLATDVM